LAANEDGRRAGRGAPIDNTPGERRRGMMDGIAVRAPLLQHRTWTRTTVQGAVTGAGAGSAQP